MPKKTFFNLEDEKREQFTTAFLREFSQKTYDEASLTAVVKDLGIAKGSVYQYFENKLDLYLYLIGVCAGVKRKYTESIQRADFPDFWAYFRALYEAGFQFDNEHPLESHFLHNLTQNLNSPSVRELFTNMQQQTVQAFEQMVRHEQSLDLFRKDIPTTTLAFYLFKIGVSIMEQLEHQGIINPNESIRQNLPVYQGKKTALLKTVDQYITLSQNAFNQQKTIQ